MQDGSGIVAPLPQALELGLALLEQIGQAHDSSTGLVLLLFQVTVRQHQLCELLVCLHESRYNLGTCLVAT